jgi:methylenetetrahydrofolate reductase (NADPH)
MNATATSIAMPLHPSEPPHSVSVSPANAPVSALERLLRQGEFIVTAEMAPPESADPNDVRDRAQAFDVVVGCINATNGFGANVHMSNLAVSLRLQPDGYEAVMQISCRHRRHFRHTHDGIQARAIHRRDD